MSSAIIPAELQAPPPLQALTSEKIHPDNITREQAVMRAMGLDDRQWKNLVRRRAKLAKTFNKTAYQLQIEEYQQQLKVLEDFATQYYTIKTERPDGWQESILTLRMDNQKAKDERARLLALLRPQAEQARMLAKMDGTIGVFEESRRRKKLHQQKYAEIKEESLHYHDMIVSTWRGLTICHHRYYRDNKMVIDTPEVERIVITDNVIFFKILTTRQSYFGYRRVLPYNVYVQDLLDEKTVKEIEGATGRQVKPVFPDKGKEDIHGYWYALNRTDTPNGILKEVAYSEVMRWYPDDHRHRVTIPVGVGEGNKIKWVNFNDFPHWLVAGSTGTGKSNFINVIFCALISQYAPADLRIVAVDLKGGVELSGYEHVPHLLGGVVQSVDGLADRLSQLEAEMTERFTALKRVGARDLFTHNQRSETSLPRIIVVIDEFASTVDQGDLTKRIHNSILQLTSKGRAVGINIIICTQDPRVDIVPGKIKANCVVRIAGRTASSENSRIIIGSGEAAKIANVKGRMLLKIEQLPIEVQTPLIQEVDIKLAIDAAVSVGDAPPMQLPEATKAEQRWTTAKIIELAIVHLGGQLSSDGIYKEVKGDGITNGQVRTMLEIIYKMESIVYDGKPYVIKRVRNQRHLVPENQTESEVA